jgi:hypothetical protein
VHATGSRHEEEGPAWPCAYPRFREQGRERHQWGLVRKQCRSTAPLHWGGIAPQEATQQPRLPFVAAPPATSATLRAVTTDLRIVEIETLRGYMELVEEFMSPGLPMWYRGAGSAAYALSPSLFRHPELTTAEELMDLETRILQRYRERSIPYVASATRPERDANWENLFVMQHFGVPTRLLDWTESPYVGLFFALTSCAFDYAAGVARTDPCVWALRPEAWNQQAMIHVSYSGGVLSIDDPLLNNYQPGATMHAMGVKPVAMYGLHNSPRIVAQRGVFTIFGKDTTPMEAVLRDSDYKDDTLIKIVVPAASVGPLRQSLFKIGITDSVVFPDLGGLALELRRFYGYEV